LKLIGEKGIIFQFPDALFGSLSGLLLIQKIREFQPGIIVLPDQGAPSAFWPKFKNSKTFLISHNNPRRYLDEPLIGLHSHKDANYAIKLEEMALKKVDVVICPSEYMKEMFIATYSFKGPIEVVPNVIDSVSIDKVENAALYCGQVIQAEIPIIYIPSAGSPYKGCQFVFEIIRRLASTYGREIGFYLTGKISNEMSRYLDFIPPNAQLISKGDIPYEINVGNIKSCTFCLSPTLVENFGMAILEAQFCGLPVITFDVGGNKEIVKDGETGYLLPFMDLEGLIEKALYLLADKDASLKLGSSAQKYSRTRFAGDRIVTQLETLFQK
jgi:glycosyltransferase involved in cell wall biosynthesis